MRVIVVRLMSTATTKKTMGRTVPMASIEEASESTLA